MSRIVPTDATASWLGVDWGAIGLVFVIGLVVTLVIVGSYSLGTRLLAVGTPDIRMPDGGDPEGSDAVVATRTRPRPLAATATAVLCYGIGAAAVVYGIYLVVPLFHQH